MTALIDLESKQVNWQRQVNIYFLTIFRFNWFLQTFAYAEIYFDSCFKISCWKHTKITTGEGKFCIILSVTGVKCLGISSSVATELLSAD